MSNEDQSVGKTFLNNNGEQAESGSGISEVEKKNIEYSEMLIEMFPDAVQTVIDKNETAMQVLGYKFNRESELDRETGTIIAKAYSPEFSNYLTSKLKDTRDSRIVSIVQTLLHQEEYNKIVISKNGLLRLNSASSPFNLDNSTLGVWVENSLASFSLSECEAFFSVMAVIDAANKSYEKNIKPDIAIDEMKSIAEKIKTDPFQGIGKE